jgi:hypothetical protein
MCRAEYHEQKKEGDTILDNKATILVRTDVLLFFAHVDDVDESVDLGVASRLVENAEDGDVKPFERSIIAVL